MLDLAHFIEALKAIAEYTEMAKSPAETPEHLRSLGGSNDERILHQGFARYINQQQLLDKPFGLIVITDQRFAFLTRKKIPMVRNTEHLVFPLKSIEKVESTKYRLGFAIQFVVDNRQYLFSLAGKDYLSLSKPFSVATMEYAGEVARLLEQAKRNAR